MPLIASALHIAPLLNDSYIPKSICINNNTAAQPIAAPKAQPGISTNTSHLNAPSRAQVCSGWALVPIDAKAFFSKTSQPLPHNFSHSCKMSPQLKGAQHEVAATSPKHNYTSLVTSCSSAVSNYACRFVVWFASSVSRFFTKCQLSVTADNFSPHLATVFWMTLSKSFPSPRLLPSPPSFTMITSTFLQWLQQTIV